MVELGVSSVAFFSGALSWGVTVVSQPLWFTSSAL